MSWSKANHIDRGLAAARPAAGAVPGKHYGWFATDTGVLSISDGSAWITIGPSVYAGVVAAFLTGATQASRYVGATTSGAPVSGTFAVGDFVIARDGHLFVCTSAGSPGTWADAGSASGVSSLAKSGSTALTGAVTLTGGTNVTLTQSGNDISIAATGGSGGVTKLYDYEVAGSDKASIDTNVDGTTVANFAGYDVLEVWIIGRTDDAGAVPDAELTVNNDTGSNYDRQVIYGNATTAGAATNLADTKWRVALHGSGGSASYPGVLRITIPGYARTVFFKTGEMSSAVPDATAGNNQWISEVLGWRSTAAITRLKIAGAGTAKLKVGSRLIVYGR